MIFYALDTNIVSYFLKNNPVIVQRINEEKDGQNRFVIPPGVYFEVQNWLVKNNSKTKMEIFQRIYEDQGIGVLDKDVFDIAVRERLALQRNGFAIEDGDLLIAAYCLKHDLTLVTNNTKHFKNIHGLKSVNWKE
ncbi:MAG: PIN domain-containing protein [Treponema sp.]|nr:PIN domain-containing protein [Treponema sp.]